MIFDTMTEEELSNSMVEGEIIRIVRGLLVRSYGALGHREFVIQNVEYDEVANTWNVELIRQVDGLTLHYEAIIDNETGRPIAFGQA